MTIRVKGLAPLLAAGVATLAVAVAPIADAAPATSVGGDDRAPGDVEINYSHPVQFPPAYPDFGSRGIFHHGHHHH
jgi:hypothetical protein